MHRTAHRYPGRAALLAGALLLAGLPHAAHAAPTAATCSGAACNGLDPMATGCLDGARVVEPDNGGVATGTLLNGQLTIAVELRWSDTCQTNWARALVVTDNTSETHNSDWDMQVWLNGKDQNGHLMVLGPTVYQRRGRLLYGNMWYAPNQQVQACVHVVLPNNRPSSPICTHAF